MKKIKEQKALMRKYKLFPLFWAVVNDRKEILLVMNILTGEFRALDK